MKRALFLDRDGVVNIDHGYVSRPVDIDFIEDVFSLCLHFQQQGYLIIIVTNQSGIGRGFYTEAEFAFLANWISAEFVKRGVELADTFYCPHHPVDAKSQYLGQCGCRKPQPGMLLQAANKYHLDLTSCIMVGDKLSDMQAAQAAGVAKRFLYGPVREQKSDVTFTQVTSLLDIIKYG
ncbi:D-glycero-beta-D-manno-heptose 1,7-bisphosphate 7-phosphatase [Aliiglaciecola sp. LCG003]|uniref:D-glycero-beta-D-manno-heptose 1,7-bisphosphate 7-phosphatase n=1 Tax=Aliiglaciecola sp. LCG003 TaxID=3053655 RepID=UPI0025723229|nr:D-glycero-beta-D-manno-heptose 1,7-bisphosphate 7-phosphatase [Aliiglaciecola sp. LCG003]WJG10982.1 D-glycero-beta-D-manno-heptose 1,7-bisphosphate 7-phosphatase [Aliiglaciecola sp. LCG003]